MAWVKLDDNFADDPRLEAAGPEAFVLHVAALCYSMRQLTDGHIPARAARRLWSVDDVDAAISALVDNGLWKPTEGGYEVVDFLDDQRDAETILRERAAAARRQKTWYENKRASKGQPPNGVSNGVRYGVANAPPSPPIPAPPPVEGRGAGDGAPRSAGAPPGAHSAEVRPSIDAVTFSFPEEAEDDG